MSASDDSGSPAEGSVVLEFERIWEELEAEDVASGAAIGYRRYGVGRSPGVLVAIDGRSRTRMLMLEAGALSIPSGLRLPSADGFHCDIVPMIGGGAGIVQVRIGSTAASFDPVFALMAADLVGELSRCRSGERDAMRALSERLELWRRFFLLSGSTGLGVEAQRGLYAELHFLTEFVCPSIGVVDAMGAWTGPLRTAHDFQLARTSVEVKSTASAVASRIRIANLRQLDPAGLAALHLFVLQLDVRRTAGESLPERVAAVRKLVEVRAPQERPALERLLIESGYSDAHEEMYRNTRYVIRGEHVFEVAEPFPSIVASDLRDGVVGAEYVIDLAACSPFARTTGALRSLMSEQKYAP